jgi:hypothetical protein
MSRFSHILLTVYTRLHILLTDFTGFWRRGLAHRLGDGITAVYRVKAGAPMRRLYCIDDFLGTMWYMLNGYTSMGLNDEDMRDDELFYVRFVLNDSFRSCLSHGFNNGHIHDLATAEPTFRPLVVFLNDINVTRSVAPLMTSFCTGNAITVRQLVTYLLSSRGLTRADADHLALRSDRLQMTFIDSDLDEIAFEDDQLIKFGV